MRRIQSYCHIHAITYADGELAAAVMSRIVGRLLDVGATCVGFLQRDEPPPAGRSRCDMVIESLATGERLKISEDRGPMARGCRLDASVLVTALAAARTAIQARPDVLVVNKFGKTEAEGGGFRELIADAIDLGIPVLIAVPWKNIESWRLFAGELATEIAADAVRDVSEAALLGTVGFHAPCGPMTWGASPGSAGPG
jgi:nucleoside-triphosphatase THEP1